MVGGALSLDQCLCVTAGVAWPCQNCICADCSSAGAPVLRMQQPGLQGDGWEGCTDMQGAVGCCLGAGELAALLLPHSCTGMRH